MRQEQLRQSRCEVVACCSGRRTGCELRAASLPGLEAWEPGSLGAWEPGWPAWDDDKGSDGGVES